MIINGGRKNGNRPMRMEGAKICRLSKSFVRGEKVIFAFPYEKGSEDVKLKPVLLKLLTQGQMSLKPKKPGALLF
jgi:hypothetical protein